MRKSLILSIMFYLPFVSLSAFAESQSGTVTLASPHSVEQTLNRLETILKQKEMTIFARIDHSAGAQKVGATLRPTQLLIFGNPKVGTPLMQCQQLAALDLPQKALAWKDENNQVWLTYNAPDYLAKRHQVSGCEAVLQKVSGALAKFSAYATAESPQ